MDQAAASPSAADEAIAVRNLQNAGVQAIVHEKWMMPGGDRATADVVIMSFASAQGAQSRALAGEGEALSVTGSAGLEVAIPGLPGHVYPRRTPDAQGFVDAEYFAAVGNLLMVVHFANTESFDQTDFGSWALGEYLTLRTARIPAAPATMIGAATTSCSPLTACLASLPASDMQITTGWGGVRTPTLDQFGQQMYPTSQVARATAELVQQGLTGTAHTVRQDTAGDEFDLILLRFKTLQGAESRTREEIGGIKGSEFAVPGPGSAEGTYTTSPDADNEYDTTVYGYVGDVAVEVHAFSGTSKDLSAAASAARQQFAEFAAVTTTWTVPQPALVVPSTAPGTPGGTFSCADALSCLISMPSGATDLDSSTYNDSPEVTVAQFIADKYGRQSSSDQSYEAGLLTSQGVREVVHRGWFGADGDQTDVVVLVFANAAEAQSDAMDYQGAISESGQLFSVTGHPHAVGSVASTLDDVGNVHAEIVAYTANSEVRMDYYSLASFDAQDAISWFDAQLAELPRS